MFASWQSLPAIRPEETLLAQSAIVDLWLYFYELTTDRALIAAQDALMNAEERRRCARYHFEKDRRMFAATRALQRCVLSEYAAVEPTAWEFGVAAHGRPHVSRPQQALSFNLSNTHGLVACAVSRHAEVGVDVEDSTRAGEVLDTAESFFAPSETQALFSIPSSERRERFFAYWTLKESYMKARGLGLLLPLDQFAFDLPATGPIRIALDPRLKDDATRWQFALLALSPRHIGAVGADVGSATMTLRAADYVPLIGVRNFG